jgi:hypothetical protein
MSLARPKKVEHRPPDNPEFGRAMRRASQGNQPLRVVMVYREAFGLTYVWHLTSFFERVCSTRLPAWEFWSYADIAQPPGAAAASDAVRVANWVVFCQATSSALPPHVQRWVESWPSQEREPQALVGFFSLTGNDSGSEGKAPACLRKLARKANRGFVAVQDCVRGARSGARDEDGSELNERQTIMREKVRQRLEMALGVTEDPATVFCVQPFSSVEHDGGELLGTLLARMMGDPNHSLLVVTEKAFVFGFGDQLGRSEKK